MNSHNLFPRIEPKGGNRILGFEFNGVRLSEATLKRLGPKVTDAMEKLTGDFNRTAPEAYIHSGSNFANSNGNLRRKVDMGGETNVISAIIG